MQRLRGQEWHLKRLLKGVHKPYAHGFVSAM
jgi:hypothetical protein